MTDAPAIDRLFVIEQDRSPFPVARDRRDALDDVETWETVVEAATRMAAGEGVSTTLRYDHEIVRLVLGDVTIVHWQQDRMNGRINRTLSAGTRGTTATMTCHLSDDASANGVGDAEEDLRAEVLLMARTALTVMSAMHGERGLRIADGDETGLLQEAAAGIMTEWNPIALGASSRLELRHRTPLSPPAVILDEAPRGIIPSMEDHHMAIAATLMSTSIGEKRSCPRIHLSPWTPKCPAPNGDPLAILRAHAALRTLRDDPPSCMIEWIHP